MKTATIRALRRATKRLNGRPPEPAVSQAEYEELLERYNSLITLEATMRKVEADSR